MSNDVKQKLFSSLVAGNIVRKTAKALPNLLPKLLRRSKQKLSEFWKRGLLVIDYYVSGFTRSIIGRRMTTEPKKIMVMNYQNNFYDNQKYIVEELLRQNKGYDIVWGVTIGQYKNPILFPEGVRVVLRNSRTFFMELMTSRIWLDNAFNCIWFPVPKRKDQYYINTWHGSLGIKRIGTKDVRGWHWRNVGRKVDKYTDYCISNSKFENEVYRTSNWPKAEIAEYGHPRNDIFFASEESKAEIYEKVRAHFNVSAEDKLILYAPTFRDTNDHPRYYNIDYDALATALSEKFGGNWVVLMRHHFHDRRKETVKKTAVNTARVLNASLYPDMQELMVVADAGISDYSSWVYDFILTGRPVFLFTVDLDHYTKTRGFYYPLQSTPFPIACNNAELTDAVSSFDEANYAKEVKNFLKDKGCVEDGHASERVVALIDSLLEK